MLEEICRAERLSSLCGFVNRNDVKRIDGVGNAFLINDHDNFGMKGDEILMRHAILLAV